MLPYFCHVTLILWSLAEFEHRLHTKLFLSENGRVVTKWAPHPIFFPDINLRSAVILVNASCSELLTTLNPSGK